MQKSIKGKALSVLLSVMLVFTFIPIAPHAAAYAASYDKTQEVLELHGDDECKSNVAEMQKLLSAPKLSLWRIVGIDEGNSKKYESLANAANDWLLADGERFKIEYQENKGTFLSPNFQWVDKGSFTVRVYDEVTVKLDLTGADGSADFAGAVKVNGEAVSSEGGKTVRVYRSGDGSSSTLSIGAIEGHSVSVSRSDDKPISSGSTSVGPLTGDLTITVAYAKESSNSFALGEGSAKFVKSATVNSESLLDGASVSVEKDQSAAIAIQTDKNAGYFISGLNITGGVAVDSVEVGGLTASASIGNAGEGNSYTVSVEGAPAMTVAASPSIEYNDTNKTDYAALKDQIVSKVAFAAFDDVASDGGVKTVEYLAREATWAGSIQLTPEVWKPIDWKTPSDWGSVDVDSVGSKEFGKNSTEKVRVSWDVDNANGVDYKVEFDVSLNDTRVETKIVVPNATITIPSSTWEAWGESSDKWEEGILGLLGAKLVEKDSDQEINDASVKLQLKFNPASVYPLDPSAPDSPYAATVSFAGDGAYKASESDPVTINVEPKPTDCTIKLGSATNVRAAKVVVGDKSNELTAAGFSIAENTDFQISVEPAEGCYVKSIKVTQNGAQVGFGNLVYSKTVATTDAIKAGTNLTYTVDVECVEVGIVLRDANPAISWNDLMDSANADDVKAAEEAIFALVDLDKSVPGLSLENATVEYDAGGLVGFKSVGYQPEGITAPLQHKFGQKIEIGEEKTETIRISFAGDDEYPAAKYEGKISLQDNRIETAVKLKTGQSIVYSPDITDAQIYNLVFESLGATATGDDAVVESPVAKFGGDDPNMTVSYDDIHAGTVNVTVKYLGSKKFAPSEASVDITVEKAPSSVSIDSQTISYKDVSSIDSIISTDPEGVSYISFAMGLDFQEGETHLHLNLPAFVDLSALDGRPDLKAFVEGILNGIYANLEGEVTVSGLSTALKNALTALESVSGYVNIDAQTIQQLITLLESIENLEGVGDLKVKVTVNDVIVPQNSGVYLVGAVTADANYKTSSGLGYLVIKPNATQVDLAFNMEDDNGFIPAHKIKGGKFDLGSHVVRGELTDEQHAAATDKLKNIYFGVMTDGSTVTSNDPLSDFGAYTQIAYISDFGNEMFWAKPITRAYAVVGDLAVVEFVDEAGQPNNDRQFIYDGQPKAMKAVAKDRSDNPLTAGTISYHYLGIEGDAEGYSSSEAPSEAGAYVVVATYTEPGNLYAGAAVGAMVIKPAEANVTVTSVTHTYDGNAVNVSSMVEVTPDDVQVAVLTAGLAVDGDFSENGLNDVAGAVNIDFPAKVDKVLKKILPDAYDKGIAPSALVEKASDVREKLQAAGYDTAALDQVIGLLEGASDKAKLTFKEQSDANPSAIGVYFVAAVVMDPNYQAASASGTLVIAPEVTQATLVWNNPDLGIIEHPDLNAGTPDFGAHVDRNAAADARGAANQNQGAADNIKYLFVGIDSNDKPVVASEPRDLPNGAYTQVACLCDGVSASMTIASPISRSLIVVPAEAKVEVADKEVLYDGNPHACEVTVAEADGTPIDDPERLTLLSVRYVGKTAEGADYDSSDAPSAVGTYTVIATYDERDEYNHRVRFGADQGTLTIVKNEEVPGGDNGSGGNGGDGGNGDGGDNNGGGDSENPNPPAGGDNGGSDDSAAKPGSPSDGQGDSPKADKKGDKAVIAETSDLAPLAVGFAVVAAVAAAAVALVARRRASLR